MSVPLPSPSSIPTSGRPIPRSRPQPISLEPIEAHSPNSPGHPASHSARRPSHSDTGLGQSPSNDSINWRERNGGSVDRRSKGPERTVGGFEKRDGSSTLGGLSQSPNSAKKMSADKTSLAHVPCRFFKAGQCTAGDNCPFSHGEGGKKEVCQWFLKGNCKFGHKCALAHIRPGEPMSMDRKNKKAAQLEAKMEKEKIQFDPAQHTPHIEASSRQTVTLDEPISAPVAIRSALSSSLASAPPQRISSSPMREPYGPPSNTAEDAAGSASAGFLGRSPGASAAFAASPNRPSPLSSSFSARLAAPAPGALTLKGSPTTAVHQIHQAVGTRPPATAAAAGFSSSFSHSPLVPEHARAPLSASFADNTPGALGRSIWARSETPDEPLSPRRLIPPASSHLTRNRPDVFEDDDDHGEDLLPSSLSDLLTPMERARRMSRRDSNESASPSRFPGQLAGAGAKPISPSWNQALDGGAERLAQSAGAAMGNSGFLQSLWSADGGDMRRLDKMGPPVTKGPEFAFGPTTAAPTPRQSLLSQQRSPASPLRYGQSHLTRDSINNGSPNAAHSTSPLAQLSRPAEVFNPDAELAPPNFGRNPDPSSPSARALSEHAPGQSLPGGVATALSRLHLAGSPAGLYAGRPSAHTGMRPMDDHGGRAQVGNGVNGDSRWTKAPPGIDPSEMRIRDNMEKDAKEGRGTDAAAEEGMFAMDG